MRVGSNRIIYLLVLTKGLKEEPPELELMTDENIGILYMETDHL